MLIAEDLHVYYGGIHALKGINLKVDKGQIVSLIGANGAGKTTTLRTVSGLLPLKNGKITFEGKQISSMPAHEIVSLGIVQVPEGRRVFTELNVLENLSLGAYLRKDKKGIESDLERVFDLFPRLKERWLQPAGTLSGGEQQMLAIGRGLMSKPRMMLLDEPSMGLAPILVKEIFSIIEEIRSMGTTILLVEQNARHALAIADYAYVLETGRIVLEGTGTEMITNEEVKRAYLGG